MNWAKIKKIAIGISIIVVIFCSFYLVFIEEFTLEPPYWIPINKKENTIIGFSILFSLLPYAIVQYSQDKWFDNIDRNVPRLLQDVTEDVKSGQSLVRALEQNTKRYGPITAPLERALIRFKFTSDYTNSMTWLGDQLIRPVAKQMAAIFIEAYEAGGRVADVLQDSVNLFKSIEENKTARKTKTKPYVIVVFVSLGIFLGISWVIMNKFLIPLNTQTQEIMNDPYGYSFILLDMAYYKSLFLWCAITESILGGLIAGKISYGKTASGLIYSLVMVFITIVFFNSII